MELAKIRSKAKQKERRADASAPPEESRPASEEPVAPPALTLPDDLFDDTANGMVIPGPAPSRTATSAVRFDPLAVLLAGRQADQRAVPAAEPVAAVVAESGDSEQYQEFLCFLLGDEEYGINIMEIKELIKPRELTEVPRAPHFVDGIISLRGVIVPVINLRKRLGLAARRLSNQERIVIVRHGESLSGLRVDAVTGVVRIADHRREATPAVLEGVDREFVAGIGRSDDRMVILLDVQHAADAGSQPGER